MITSPKIPRSNSPNFQVRKLKKDTECTGGSIQAYIWSTVHFMTRLRYLTLAAGISVVAGVSWWLYALVEQRRKRRKGSKVMVNVVVPPRQKTAPALPPGLDHCNHIDAQILRGYVGSQYAFLGLKCASLASLVQEILYILCIYEMYIYRDFAGGRDH